MPWATLGDVMRTVRNARERLRATAARVDARRVATRRAATVAGMVISTIFMQTGALATSDEPPVERTSFAAMTVGPLTTQPIGHYSFCKSAPEECVAGRRAAPAPLTTTRWIAITEINASVNAAVMPRTDAEMHGLAELWSYPELEGDCEDYVLLKRRQLIEHGFDPANLLITVVRKPDGEGHAVLTVRTERGDYVLDNLTDRVRHWRDTPYRFLKRQASHHAGRWVDIEDGTATMVGAVE